MLSQEFIERLKKSARCDTFYDLAAEDEDLTVNDIAGGNIDDAYESGREDGDIELAREVLAALGETW